MSSSSKSFDLIVIGGGISGLGVALEASYWGFEVLLLEKDRCCAATSNNSLRIMHGGFRYLQSLNIPRVRQSIEAQAELLRDYPSHVAPLPCLMPLEKSGLRSRWPVSIALKLYSLIASHQSDTIRPGRILNRETVAREVPILENLAPYGALLWYDAELKDPPAFAALIKQTAAARGATIMEQASVTSVERAQGGFAVRYRSTERMEIGNARVVINCSGPWLDTIGPAGGMRERKHQWCKAFNLVFGKRPEGRHGISFRSSQGRLYFMVPREEGCAVGTQYLPHDGSPDALHVSDAEVETFYSEFKACVPELPLARSDLIGIEAGILPVKRYSGGLPELYGAEEISADRGYIEVLSTKYTTFLAQGRKAMLAAAPFLERPAK